MSESLVSLCLPKPTAYRLAASNSVLLNFPASQSGSTAPALNLAFPVDEEWAPVGISVTEDEHALELKVVSNPGNLPSDILTREVTRILNLEGDGEAYLAVGQRDPVIGALQTRYQGFRPVQFHTPYEAAVWAIVGHRIRMSQAATIKNRLAAEAGTRITFPGGQVLDAFPSPEQMLSIPEFRGLVPEKIHHLHALAEAALDGTLSTARLLSMSPDAALRDLQRLPGIGPFSSELILIRGVGYPDWFPRYEPRFTSAMERLYETSDPERLTAIAEHWKPYRSWVAVLIRRWLADNPIDR